MSATVARGAFWCAFVVGGVMGPANAQAGTGAPVPPQTQTAQVAKRIIYNGLDMHATVFQSSLTQQQIVDFYKQQWGKKTVVNTLQASRIVGHLEGDDFITVQVSPDGAGSKGTIGVVKLPPTDAPRPDLGKGLPQPFGAKVVNDIGYPDDRTPARTVLLVDQLSPSQNGSWFRSHLIADGWKDAGANKCAYGADHCVMAFSRASSNMMFVAQRHGRQSQIVMNIQNPAPQG